ncbi:MAG: hypothetical protein WCO09_03235 [bacterium]
MENIDEIDSKEILVIQAQELDPMYFCHSAFASGLVESIDFCIFSNARDAEVEIFKNKPQFFATGLFAQDLRDDNQTNLINPNQEPPSSWGFCFIVLL